MKIDQIVEKYLNSIKKWDTIVDVFINPTPSEMKELGRNIRFIADNTDKKLYVWPAMGALHIDVWKDLRLPHKLYKNPEVVSGEVEGSVISVEALYNMHQDIRKQTQALDWTWVTQFNLETTIKRVK